MRAGGQFAIARDEILDGATRSISTDAQPLAFKAVDSPPVTSNGDCVMGHLNVHANAALRYRVCCVSYLAIALLLLAGCDWHSSRTRHWMEDVLLDDGSTIQVIRSVTFGESNSVSGDAYNLVEAASTMSFTGELQHLPEWNQPLRAITLYRDSTTQEWVVVASTTSCRVWAKKGMPRPPYWEFRLADNVWREVSFSPTSVGRDSNLFRKYHSR